MAILGIKIKPRYCTAQRAVAPAIEIEGLICTRNDSSFIQCRKTLSTEISLQCRAQPMAGMVGTGGAGSRTKNLNHTIEKLRHAFTALR